MALSKGFIQAKVLDVEVFAGRAVRFDDARVVGYQFIPKPPGLGSNEEAYMAKIVGDSLVDQWIRHGDLIVFKLVNKAVPGRLYLISMPDGLTAKFVEPLSDGRLKLTPGNKKMKPTIVSESDVTICGLVIGNYHPFIWDESGEGIARILAFQRPPIIEDDEDIPF